ncbi:sugar transferase [Alkalibacter saccharofermentans]|uniref:Exopolysaccharide biosynthesis polyprenyl glycosylphosphotransferase n=1 Tax=Alkalibacter saccharofermentans DSM 14828 TaxID=1120975 RepID=A0A1M4ZH37_9FIRM|nr:sugar transferase [Alkalibacter saccharofermentans]SHF16906.1 exopolysaccharide biosynthesis polyprenyl glycosylphosphotransferase [Alkalibacter saccharofermentans DSM 14828]
METNNNLKMHFVFLMQLLELVLVVILTIASFMIAGRLTYNTWFPFGAYYGLIFFTLATAVEIMLLAHYKYFHFLDMSFSGVMGKAAGVVLLLNYILIIMLYFTGSVRMSVYYFIVAAAVQVVSLVWIKTLSTILKRNALKGKISLIIGNPKDKDDLLRVLKGQSINRLTFVPENHECVKTCIDKADNIYLMTPVANEFKREIIAYCEIKNKRLLIVPEIHEIAMRDSEMTQIGDVPLFTIEGFRLSEAQAIVKRMIDIVLAVVGILLTTPILFIAAFFIKLEDGGPVFFTQVRSGLKQKQFEMMKLRSMVVDAEKHTGAVLAAENDPRITRVGRIIRATRIDEIPQFFNVLEGSMSIVGPRPERPVFVEAFIKEFPEYVHRYEVKPGITGLAQVMSNYATSVENKLKFDLVYIKRYSPGFDFNILLKTIKVVFTKEQSAGVKAEEPGSDNVVDIEEMVDYIDKKSFNKTFNMKKAMFMFVSCAAVVAMSILFRYTSLVVAAAEAIAYENQYVTQTRDGFYIIEDYQVPAAVVEDRGFLTLSFESASNMDIHLTKRLQGVYILITKIPPEDIIQIDEFSKDGLTLNEISRIKSILEAHCNEKELELFKSFIDALD